MKDHRRRAMKRATERSGSEDALRMLAFLVEKMIRVDDRAYHIENAVREMRYDR